MYDEMPNHQPCSVLRVLWPVEATRKIRQTTTIPFPKGNTLVAFFINFDWFQPAIMNRAGRMSLRQLQFIPSTGVQYVPQISLSFSILRWNSRNKDTASFNHLRQVRCVQKDWNRSSVCSGVHVIVIKLQYTGFRGCCFMLVVTRRLSFVHVVGLIERLVLCVNNSWRHL